MFFRLSVLCFFAYGVLSHVDCPRCRPNRFPSRSCPDVCAKNFLTRSFKWTFMFKWSENFLSTNGFTFSDEKVLPSSKKKRKYVTNRKRSSYKCHYPVCTYKFDFDQKSIQATTKKLFTKLDLINHGNDFASLTFINMPFFR